MLVTVRTITLVVAHLGIDLWDYESAKVSEVSKIWYDVLIKKIKSANVQNSSV